MDNRVARCHLLMEVLIADGVLTADEKALLEKHLEDHALSDEECQQVRSRTGYEEAVRVMRERPEIERQEVLEQLAECALADGKLTSGELQTVARIRKELGL